MLQWRFQAKRESLPKRLTARSYQLGWHLRLPRCMVAVPPYRICAARLTSGFRSLGRFRPKMSESAWANWK